MPNKKNHPGSRIPWTLFIEALRDLRKHEPLQIAGAASFFAVFALPAIVIILSALFGSFSNSFTIREDLLKELGLSIDKETITQVSKTVSHVWVLPLSVLAQILGFIFLFFVATTFFAVIRGSLNQLWNVKVKKNGIAFVLIHRAMSLLAIIIAGIFVLIIVTINKMNMSHGRVFLERMMNFSAGLIFAVIWFVGVFRFLADGRPGWRAAVFGGVLAGILFTLGRIVLHVLLTYHKVHTIYGASTAMVMLLLFVFYSALTFYYSACFVRVLSVQSVKPIRS